jgi:hypothetical protein
MFFNMSSTMSRTYIDAIFAMMLLAHNGFAVQPDQPLPDPKLTPGATLDVTTKDICVTGYTKKVRNVPALVKRQVYQEYGAVNRPGAYEVDHLIPLELGGSNSIKNLWPESYSIEWNARIKDELENRLHVLVCKGTITLTEAQKAITTNWIAAYKRYFRTDRPLSPAEARRVSKRRSQ